jgi:anti-sigma factor RsiW
VFIFPERSLLLSSKLPGSSLDENANSPKKMPFNTETWSQGGLRYFVVGDTSAADIDSLAKLFKAAS